MTVKSMIHSSDTGSQKKKFYKMINFTIQPLNVKSIYYINLNNYQLLYYNYYINFEVLKCSFCPQIEDLLKS